MDVPESNMACVTEPRAVQRGVFLRPHAFDRGLHEGLQWSDCHQAGWFHHVSEGAISCNDAHF